MIADDPDPPKRNRTVTTPNRPRPAGSAPARPLLARRSPPRHPPAPDAPGSPPLHAPIPAPIAAIRQRPEPSIRGIRAIRGPHPTGLRPRMTRIEDRNPVGDRSILPSGVPLGSDATTEGGERRIGCPFGLVG